MEKQIITFSANEQQLLKTGGIHEYASDTVSYIEAQFDLGQNWSGYDSVRAVWATAFGTVISTVLDADGICMVPVEVLTRRAEVYVNLVGSISENSVLTDRLTTFRITALVVKQKINLTGSETVPITASQFEQFAEIVRDEAASAEQSMRDAKDYADAAKISEDNAKISEDNAAASEANAYASEVNAKASEDNAAASEETALDAADRAEQAAAQSGYMYFHIDEYGHLIYSRTSNTEVDFYLENGHLFVEAIA